MSSDRNGTNTNPIGSGVDEFTQLLDCPSTFAGSANKYVTVNSGETALTFTAGGGGGGNTEFIQGTDTPMTYTGTNLYDIVNINNLQDGVQFTSLPLIAKTNLPLTGLSDYQQTGYTPTGGYLTSTGSGWIVTPAPVPPSGGNDLYVLDTYSNSVTLGSSASNTYLLDLNYVVSNDGFTVSLPNNFSPTITTRFNVNWEFRLSINNSGSFGSNGPILTIDLILPSGAVVQNLLTKTYPYNTLPIHTDTFFTESGLTESVTLNAGSNYQIRYRMTNANSQIYYAKYNKSIQIDGNAPFYLEQANDYLTFGYGTSGETLVSNGVNGFTLQTLPKTIITQDDYLTSGYGTSGQVITSNGINGFTLQTPTAPDTELIQLTDCPNNYGTANQVLTSSGSAVVWADVPIISIPDPLEVNNINERTSGAGTTINGNTNIMSAGIQLQYNNLQGEPASFLNAYYVRKIYLNLIDSYNLVTFYTSLPFLVTRIGDQINMRMYKQGINYASINPLQNIQSYVKGSTTVPAAMRPASTQLAPAVMGFNNNWNDTSIIFRMSPDGNFSIQGGNKQGSPNYGGFGFPGQTIYLNDQNFFYSLTN